MAETSKSSASKDPSPAAALNCNLEFWSDMYAFSQDDAFVPGSSDMFARSQDDAFVAGSSDMFARSQDEGLVPESSRRDYEWGNVFDKSRNTEKRKRRKKSVVNSSTAVNSACDLSEAPSAVPAALSLSSSSHSSGDKRDQEKNNGELELLEHFLEKGDRDDSESSETSADEIQAKSNFQVNEETEKNNFQLPELGMAFSSEEEAYRFYENYANKIGFRVRKGKVQRLCNGTIRKRFFFCSRQGFRSKKRPEKVAKYTRKETRTGCDAKIQYTVENGNWVVSQFFNEHNHHLESQRLLIGSCTKISKANMMFEMETLSESAQREREDISKAVETGQLKRKDAEVHCEHSNTCHQPTQEARKTNTGVEMGKEFDVSLSSNSFQIDFRNISGGDGSSNKRMELETEGACSGATSLIWQECRFSSEQTAFLEEMFKEHDYYNPNPTQLATGKQLNLDRGQAEVWFSLKRAREKSGQWNYEFLKKEIEHIWRHCSEFFKSENEALKSHVQSLERACLENMRAKQELAYIKSMLAALLHSLHSDD